MKEKFLIKEFVEMLHFDFKNISNDLKIELNESESSYSKVWKEHSSKFDNYIIKNIEEFENNLNIFLNETTKEDISSLLLKDKENLAALLNTFDSIRFKLINNDEYNSKLEAKCLEHLVKDGCAIYKSLFSEEELAELLKFTKVIEDVLNVDIKKAGYVNVQVNQKGQITNIWNSFQKVDDGQLRMQSKSVGFFPPGSEVIIKNKSVKSIFENWYVNSNCNFHRTNLEWISKSDTSHNGWHLDTVRDQLKIMVLLNDVDLDAAPIFCAKKSHLNNTEIKKETIHDLFVSGHRKRKEGVFYKKHAAALEHRHVGYLTDSDTDNLPANINNDPIEIKGVVFDKLVGTGKAGDCIFFESMGFHSGNRSTDKTRKTIVLVVDPVNTSFKNKFIDKFAGKVGV